MKKILIEKILMKKIKYRMCLVFVFEAFQVILGYSENTHMVKLIFKAYKKLIIYLFAFFLFVKMLTGYYKKKKIKKSFQKRLVKGTKIFLKKKKTNGTNMLVSNIEISLKKKKKRSVNMVVNNIKIFQRMTNKSYLSM